MLNAILSTPKLGHKNRFTKFQLRNETRKTDNVLTKTNFLFNTLVIIVAVLFCITCCQISYDSFLNGVKAAACGLAIVCFSWDFLYFDSAEPGVMPPSPLNPQIYEGRVMYTLHTSYLFSLIFGIHMAVMVYLWT